MTLTEFIAEAKRLVLDAYAEESVAFVCCTVDCWTISHKPRVMFSVTLELAGQTVMCVREGSAEECLAALQRYLRPAMLPLDADAVVEALGALPTV